MPFISVIMACHNGDAYVTGAIRSVLRQSFTDFELVFVDDCSTDGSAESARTIGSTDSRITILETGKNVGPAMARNLAIEHARGEWLAILDADDLWLPYKLSRQADLIAKESQDLLLVGSGCYHVDEKGCRIATYTYPVASHALKTHLRTMRRFPPHSSLLYRSSAIRQMRGFNPKFVRSQDADLCLRLSENGRFRCIRDPLIEYRVHEASISRNPSGNGISQLDYGTAARVCQMLRRSGAIDPASSDDGQLWNRFILHVARTNAAGRYSEYVAWKMSLKHALGTREGRGTKAPTRGGLKMASFSWLFLFVRERLFGCTLPRICFESWTALTRGT